MNFLPDIVDGELVEAPQRKLYTPPVQTRYQVKKEEQSLSELNNLGREEVAEDFSDAHSLRKLDI